MLLVSRRRIKLWDLATHAEKKTLDVDDGAVMCLAATPDGRLLVSGSRGKTIKWVASHTRLLACLQRACASAVARVCAPKAVLRTHSWPAPRRLWDLRTFELKASLKGHSCDVYGLCITLDGLSIVSASYDKTVRCVRWPASEIVRTCSACCAPAPGF